MRQDPRNFSAAGEFEVEFEVADNRLTAFEEDMFADLEPPQAPSMKWRRVASGEVWVDIDAGNIVVFGRPWEVEPEEDIADDDPRAHNCDAAACASCTHVIARGRIAGRPA